MAEYQIKSKVIRSIEQPIIKQASLQFKDRRESTRQLEQLIQCQPKKRRKCPDLKTVIAILNNFSLHTATPDATSAQKTTPITDYLNTQFSEFDSEFTNVINEYLTCEFASSCKEEVMAWLVTKREPNPDTITQSASPIEEIPTREDTDVFPAPANVQVEVPPLSQKLSDGYSFCIDRVQPIWNQCYSKEEIESIIFAAIFPLSAGISPKHIGTTATTATSVVTSAKAANDMGKLNDFLANKKIDNKPDQISFSGAGGQLQVTIDGTTYGCSHNTHGRGVEWASGNFYPISGEEVSSRD